MILANYLCNYAWFMPSVIALPMKRYSILNFVFIRFEKFGNVKGCVIIDYPALTWDQWIIWTEIKTKVPWFGVMMWSGRCFTCPACGVMWRDVHAHVDFEWMLAEIPYLHLGGRLGLYWFGGVKVYIYIYIYQTTKSWLLLICLYECANPCTGIMNDLS